MSKHARRWTILRRVYDDWFWLRYAHARHRVDVETEANNRAGSPGIPLRIDDYDRD